MLWNTGFSRQDRRSGTAIRRALAAALSALLPWAALAGPQNDPALLCERAAAQAAQAMGVPVAVLRAIALTETGRKRGTLFRPWPWAVNMEGEGVWFDTPQEARAYVQRHFDRGARNFDIGCFQINYRWHGDAFASISQMFDPQANALHAARYLRALYDELGDWSVAAGAYHSRTPHYAAIYRKRFDGFHAAVLNGGEAELPIPVMADGQTMPRAAPLPRVNLYPLLQGGGGGKLGSLVPVSGLAGRPFIGQEGAP